MLLILDETAKCEVKIDVQVDFLNCFLCLGLPADVDSGNDQVLPQQLVLHVVVAGVAV